MGCNRYRINNKRILAEKVFTLIEIRYLERLSKVTDRYGDVKGWLSESSVNRGPKVLLRGPYTIKCRASKNNCLRRCLDVLRG